MRKAFHTEYKGVYDAKLWLKRFFINRGIQEAPKNFEFRVLKVADDRLAKTKQKFKRRLLEAIIQETKF